MPKKKKRPRQRPPASTPPPPRGGANLERRDRKEEARRARETEQRRARRRSAFRRTFTSIGIAAAVVAAIAVFQSLQGPNDIPPEAIRAAERANCTAVDQPASSAPGNQHLQEGQLPYRYADPPATSGFHETTWISEPKVFDTQPPETRAVHSLEHGAVFVYYLPEAEGGVAQAIVDRLAELAEGDRATFLAPHPALTPETALTLTAWNRRQACPTGGALTPASAATIVNGFVTAFECTSNAPEGGNPPC
ncbi:MAG: DUF3105 domain-containing protein [Actinomycetota bacterium]